MLFALELRVCVEVRVFVIACISPCVCADMLIFILFYYFLLALCEP
jgi:hypothetical protein